jgi:O-antigen ligase
MMSGLRGRWVNVAVILVAFIGFFISSSGLEVFKAGGAREENVEYAVEPYIGFLNYVTHAWVFLTTFIFFLCFFKSKVCFLRFTKESLFIVALFTFIFLSVTWSIYPKTSFNNFILLLCFAMLAYAHVWKLGNEALKHIEYFLLVILAASYLMIFFMPSYGIAIGRHEGAWQGIFSHKNNLGVTCDLALAFILGIKRKNIASFCIKFLMIWILLVMSKSYTSILTALIMISFYLVFFKFSDVKLSNRIVLFSLVIVFLTGMSAIFISQSGWSINIFGKSTDFSSRNLIWDFLIGMVSDKPFQGYGLATFQEFSKDNSNLVMDNIGGVVNNTHNGFIDALFSLGIIGFILAVLFTFWTPALNMRNKYFPLASLVAVIFILNNSFESRFFSFNHLIMIYFYIFFFGSMSKHHFHISKFR